MADDTFGVLMVVVAVATLPVGILALLFAGWKLSAVVFVVGWFLLTPLLPIVGEELLPALGGSGSDEQSADPLTELKQRYARGELSDEEFERRVGNLVETEDVEVDRDLTFDSEQNGGVSPEREAERSRE